MRKDEEGNECPHTLGEYRKLCVSIGGVDCPAVAWLDQQISENKEKGEDELVIVSDSQMRFVLMPLLLPPPSTGQDSAGRPLSIGSKVRFRGHNYTIKSFLPGQGTGGCAGLLFEESEIHTNEKPTEISVDLVSEES